MQLWTYPRLQTALAEWLSSRSIKLLALAATLSKRTPAWRSKSALKSWRSNESSPSRKVLARGSLSTSASVQGWYLSLLGSSTSSTCQVPRKQVSPGPHKKQRLSTPQHFLQSAGMSRPTPASKGPSAPHIEVHPWMPETDRRGQPSHRISVGHALGPARRKRCRVQLGPSFPPGLVRDITGYRRSVTSLRRLQHNPYLSKLQIACEVISKMRSAHQDIPELNKLTFCKHTTSATC